MRLIDADAIMEALNIFNDKVNGNEHFLFGIETAKEIINNAPTIEAEPEGVSPKMEEIEWDTQFVIASCGQCGKRLLGRSEDITNYFRYCPTCGRKVKWG